MPSAASRTSLSAAKPAATPGRTLPVVPVNILPLFAPLAAARLGSPSSRSPTAPSTAASALLR